MPLTIRDATPRDATVIADFNRRIATETEDKQLEPALVLAGVQALLADASKGRYWVAETSGVIVGQIMTTFEWSDWRNGMIWWLQSVYVQAQHRRSGVFSALFRHVESLAMATPGVVGMRLCVERENGRAQATYDHLGLGMTDYRVMETIWSASAGREGEQQC